MREYFNQHILSISISGVLIVLLFFITITKDMIVEKYIVPTVITELQAKDHINNNNNLDNSDKHKTAQTALEKFNKQQEKANTKLEALEKQVNDLSQKYNVAQENSLTDKKKIEELNLIVMSLANKELKVKLFVSKQDIDEGYIILNLKSVAINHLIENGQKYRIYGTNGHYADLIARVEPANDLNSGNENETIGRVYIDSYHDIFSGSTAGTRIATIKLEKLFKSSL